MTGTSCRYVSGFDQAGESETLLRPVTRRQGACAVQVDAARTRAPCIAEAAVVRALPPAFSSSRPEGMEGSADHGSSATPRQSRHVDPGGAQTVARKQNPPRGGFFREDDSNGASRAVHMESGNRACSRMDTGPQTVTISCDPAYVKRHGGKEIRLVCTAKV